MIWKLIIGLNRRSQAYWMSNNFDICHFLLDFWLLYYIIE
nr:MAG TPA: hypothetical protein [Crassvirales sp.]